MYFVDTSVLIKAYVREKGTETVHEAFRRLDGYLSTSYLIAIETLANLTRLLRSREISQKTYTTARDDFLNHLRTRFHVVPTMHSAELDALVLVDQYHDRGIGGMDLVHICAAEYLQGAIPETAVAIMCSDRKMRSIARSRGFDVFDPERDPLTAIPTPASGS